VTADKASPSRATWARKWQDTKLSARNCSTAAADRNEYLRDDDETEENFLNNNDYSEIGFIFTQRSPYFSKKNKLEFIDWVSNLF